ncbi:MAG: hypothetical protein ACREU2_10445 [Steroidobacteraceae bacterium]
MAHVFQLNSAALKRTFAAYVVIARGRGQAQLYVGKTGDNRQGCNPLISRCGNHFSYNPIHSQIRNKIEAHESCLYTYVFDHFDGYCAHEVRRRFRVEKINEIERWINTEIQKAVRDHAHIEIVNPFLGRVRVSDKERRRRKSFRTPDARRKVDGILKQVRYVLSIRSSGTE